jgi:haloalkane dehalogenase
MSTAQERVADRRTFAPTQITRPAWLDHAVYPFQSRFVNIDGNRLHYIDEYIDEGNGPTLLFLHANPLWSFQYRHIIEPLRSRFRCVALDYPGFGLSEARPGFITTLAGNSNLVEQFIRTLNLDEITLVAHDASVSIGLGIVTRQPTWFRSLILSNGFAWPLSEDPSIHRFIKVVASPFFRFMLVNFNVLVRWTVANFSKLSEVEARAYLMPHTGRGLRHHQHDFFRSIVNRDEYLSTLKRRLPEIAHFPTLLLFADNDPTYKAGWMQRYEHIFPRHESVRIEGSHHFPQEYNPAVMVQAITTWWEQEMA